MIDELKKYKKLYKSIWNDEQLKKYNIKFTTINKTSLSFVPEGQFQNRKQEIEIKVKTLVDIFKIRDKDLFTKKFNMAISGIGQELQNMLTLRSSALCPLLFFYNCENEPIKMTLNDKLVLFDKSFFEWKNPAINFPSNMDVVLYSTKDNILFFIESKFSEYIDNTNHDISSDYLKDPITEPVYKKIFELGYYKQVDSDKKKKHFKLQSEEQEKKEPHYTEGIKQNISHYCGIINFLNNKKSSDNNYIKELPLNENTKYYFNEILFVNDKMKKITFRNKESCFEDYSNQYKQLAEILTADIKKRGITNFTVLPELYTYKKLKDENPELNSEIINFYFSD